MNLNRLNVLSESKMKMAIQLFQLFSSEDRDFESLFGQFLLKNDHNKVLLLMDKVGRSRMLQRHHGLTALAKRNGFFTSV